LVDDDNTAVIIEATEAISKSFRQYLSNTPGKHEIKGHCTHTAGSADVKV
jgi:hypothetical protein